MKTTLARTYCTNDDMDDVCWSWISLSGATVNRKLSPEARSAARLIPTTMNVRQALNVVLLFSTVSTATVSFRMEALQHRRRKWN